MITDFVHLNWMFVEKDGYPKNSEHYLCLIREKDKCRILILWFDNDDNAFSECTFDDFTYEPVFIKYSGVVAWADPTRFCFTCDPEKYEGCDKDLCYTRNHGPFSPHYCKCTTHLEYAKGYDFH